MENSTKDQSDLPVYGPIPYDGRFDSPIDKKAHKKWLKKQKKMEKSAKKKLFQSDTVEMVPRFPTDKEKYKNSENIEIEITPPDHETSLTGQNAIKRHQDNFEAIAVTQNKTLVPIIANPPMKSVETLAASLEDPDLYNLDNRVALDVRSTPKISPPMRNPVLEKVQMQDSFQADIPALPFTANASTEQSQSVPSEKEEQSIGVVQMDHSTLSKEHKKSPDSIKSKTSVISRGRSVLTSITKNREKEPLGFEGEFIVGNVSKKEFKELSEKHKQDNVNATANSSNILASSNDSIRKSFSRSKSEYTLGTALKTTEPKSEGSTVPSIVITEPDDHPPVQMDTPKQKSKHRSFLHLFFFKRKKHICEENTVMPPEDEAVDTNKMTEIVKQGYLRKKGRFIPWNWKCRYFILRNDCLICYKKFGSIGKTTIPIHDIRSVKKRIASGKKPYRIIIDTDHSLKEICAHTEMECEQWIDAINAQL